MIQTNLRKLDNFKITVSSEFANASYIVIFIRNNHNITDRCTIYSEIPLMGRKTQLETISKFSTITWVFVVVLLCLLCLSVGIIFYIYKKKTTKKSQENASLKLISTTTTPSRQVEIGRFEEYLTKALINSELRKQYKNITNSVETKSHQIGLKPENALKNRNKNIIPYDETRVTLEPLYFNEEEYLNANYINGFEKDKTYIATQVPTLLTLVNFWRMIWQENVECIVMLCKLSENGKKKCEMYWPLLDQSLQIGEIKITCTAIKTTGATFIRTLIMSIHATHRKVTQLHYEKWPDHDIPDNVEDVRNLLNLLGDFQEKDTPIVVHSSVGVGRAGTFILCNIAIRMAETTGQVDMPSILYSLRMQRMKMVETLEQYVYAHNVVTYAAGALYSVIQ